MRKITVVIYGIAVFTAGFVSALVLSWQFYSNIPNEHPIHFTNEWKTTNPLMWQSLVDRLHSADQFATIKALESMQIVATFGPLSLLANVDASAYVLIKNIEEPFIFNFHEYTEELVVAEFPIHFVCSERQVIDTVARISGYYDPNKLIIAARYKNEKEDFYIGSYSIVTSKGTVNLLDTQGYGIWDILDDGIHGRTYDSVGFCWVERESAPCGYSGDHECNERPRNSL